MRVTENNRLANGTEFYFRLEGSFIGGGRRCIGAIARRALEAVDWEAEIKNNPDLGRDMSLPDVPLRIPRAATWYGERMKTCRACDAHEGCPVWAKREYKTAAGCCENQMQAYLKKPLAACLGLPPRWLPVKPEETT